MPLYEYECKQCHRRTEKIQKFSDLPLAACPHCGGPLEQLIHAPAISFKGGGWYADLYSSSKSGSSSGNGAKGNDSSSKPPSASDSSSSPSSSSATTTPASTSSNSVKK